MTMSVFALLLSLLPVPVLLAYFTRGDRRLLRCELFWISAGLGFIAAMPIGLLEMALMRLVGASGSLDAYAATHGFLFAALPEEVGKYLILMRFIVRHADFTRPPDAALFGLAISLGFATFENFGYVAAASDWTAVALLRDLTAVPMHAAAGFLMGFFAARALTDDGRRTLYGALALAAPLALHGTYDFAVITTSAALQHLHGHAALPAWIYAMLLCLALAAIGLCGWFVPRLPLEEARDLGFAVRVAARLAARTTGR